MWLFRRIKLTILAIFLKSDIKWRHLWRHNKKIINFCFLKMISLCSSLILLSDRYNFTLHHIVYRKLLYEIYGLYLKNAKNCQKWRLYDVKIIFWDFFLHFWIPRKIYFQIGWVIFCHTSYSGVKTVKSVFFGVFPIFL